MDVLGIDDVQIAMPASGDRIEWMQRMGEGGG